MTTYPNLSPNTLVFINHEPTPRNKKVSLPETFKTLKDRFFPVNASMLAYVKGILKAMCPGLSDADFEKNMHSLYTGDRAFSNKHPYPDNFSIENLDCGGNCRRVTTGKPFKKVLFWWYEVQAIDPSHLPNTPADAGQIDFAIHTVPTISTTIKILNRFGVWTHQYRKNAFPQFNGRSLVPYFGAGGVNYVRADRVTALSGQVMPSPFVP